MLFYKPLSNRQHLLAVLSLAFLVRLINLSYSPLNPLTYYPSADEDYYISFAMNVAQGQFGLTPDFIFMDPLYGYLLGSIFYLFGNNLLIVYLLQTIIDTATTFLIYLVGKELWNHRAGIISACFYALSSTALMYTTKILKPTLVANFIILSTLLAIRMWKTENLSAWVWYGTILGIGVSIRSNLLLIAIAGIIIVPWGNYKHLNLNLTQYTKRCALIIFGFSIPLILLGARNLSVTGNWLILPPNSGVVFHQIYNHSNPSADHKIPEFVRYSNPTEIWYSYRNEAAKRLNKQLTTNEVSNYWRNQALDYISSHQTQVLSNIVRKLWHFTTFKEISFNRSLGADELFSPILSFLPRPFGWLFALGVPGLMLLVLKTPRAWPMVMAAGATIATFVLFIAASRFRFHLLPLFAVGSGVFLAALSQWKQQHSGKNIVAISLATCLAITTLFAGKHTNEHPIDFIPIAWGYLKIGQYREAENYVKKELNKNPSSADAHELLGYLAYSEHQYEQAIQEFKESLKHAYYRHVVHYNLGLCFEKTGKINKALDAINIAVSMNPLHEYLYKQGELYEMSGMHERAMSSYKRIINTPAHLDSGKNFSIKAKKRIKQMSGHNN